MKRIAVFASGNGSNFQALADAWKQNLLKGDLYLLVCDRPEAYVIKRAHLARIPVLIVEPKKFSSREHYEQYILERLDELEIEYIVLAGYMRLVGPTLLHAFPNRIINLHPSLLPEFPGIRSIERALEAGVPKTGVTVHFVDEGMDTGPIILQEELPILIEDTIETLAMRVHEMEHRLLLEAVNLVVTGKISVCGREVHKVKKEEE
jgi:phosphoribosylglycinamide formyltransferase-1